MRQTIVMASFVGLVGACAPLGSRDGDNDTDAGVDAAAAGGPCTDLTELTMDITVTGSAGFNDLPTSCWTLNGKLVLAGPAVTSLAKLGDLRRVTDLEIDDTDLTTFDTASSIDVTGTISVHHNDRLTDIDKVMPKTTVTAIAIEHNAMLANLGNLHAASVVSTTTSIVDNPKLTSIDLGSARRLEAGLTISDNPLVTTIDLHSLESAGPLSIAHNAALTAITTSATLTNVHGGLVIDDNDALATLGTFGLSLIVDANLLISNNAALADVGKLGRAQRIFGTAQITGNSALSTTRAHDIGCCVLTAAYAASNNQGTNCSGNHWCKDNHGCYR
jgi:hypothetical protein